MVSLPERDEWHRPVVMMAFEGWNDAGDAASGAVEHMIEQSGAEVVAELDPEPYYDFQVARPTITVDENGVRALTWPGARFSAGRLPGSDRDLVLLNGIEPSMRWPTFCREIADVCEHVGAERVVLLGALLADVPHRRPIPVTAVAGDPDLRQRLSLEPSRYQGPTGIIGVLQDVLSRRSLPTVSLWAAVPYYVAQPPCPRATLALVHSLGDVAGLDVAEGDLPAAGKEWEENVEEMVAEDPEIAELVERLEQETPEVDLQRASGDAIAREFERYLRRRDEDDPPGR